ncbi:MAG: HD domain-containing protein [Gammaproteobacteria bacterium]
MDDLVSRAQRYATQAHRRIDQRRKYSGQPYDTHLKAVADIVRSVTDDPQTLAAAWLHDTLEDTPATYEEIESEFGTEVAHLVEELTDVSRPADGNRAVRKAIDRRHLARASARAKTIKLADLIDNCADIAGHDAKFGRVFISEAAVLLEVLLDGDQRLLTRARKQISKYAEKLGLPPLQAELLALDEDLETASKALHYRPPVARLFIDAFRATDIAEPLRSFDSVRDPEDIGRVLKDYDAPVAGIRIDGVMVGFASRAELDKGPEHARLRAFSADQIVDGNASLAEVVHVLNRHEFCFVGMLDEVIAYVGRSDFHKPVVRMWLFGIVTLVEMEVTERIAARWPDESWRSLISPTRLEKAEALKAERERRGSNCRLLDCLQLSDKGRLVLANPEFLAELEFRTAGAFKRALKELEGLRNNLAHGQEFVTDDWAQIVRMVLRMEEIAGAER